MIERVKIGLLYSLFVGLISCNKQQGNVVKDNTITSSYEAAYSTDTSCNIQINEADGLIVYYPQYQQIDLVCGTRPTPKDLHVLIACEAAFTGELLNEFKHSNIAGNHTSGGQYFKGYRCKANTGCFAWYGDKDEWTFAMNDYNKYVVQASTRKGMAFGQVMVVFNGKLQDRKPQKATSVNYYRVLAELDGKLCIIDSKNKMQYSKFEQALLGLNVKYALYMDMGTGWNYSFYRGNDNKVHYIHEKYTKYATNWVVFKK